MIQPQTSVAQQNRLAEAAPLSPKSPCPEDTGGTFYNFHLEKRQLHEGHILHGSVNVMVTYDTYKQAYKEKKSTSVDKVSSFNKIRASTRIWINVDSTSSRWIDVVSSLPRPCVLQIYIYIYFFFKHILIFAISTNFIRQYECVCLPVIIPISNA